ncbi:thioredoxin-like negative regulator of GroEL [Sphingomonas naasensis]|uniref:Tetratricopeptide repeat protein n=1 Tax=Sphingomonas naasensis TaxID=1344951 RepID=A0A4S1WTX9_9SPHN|nr:tetratricopeptide repeat protein [Sphingomonas naasensis]NIJ18985.1 thioredoxin-like negative regulator of GroEL [Sphingomonas naasensis]TGX46195.1 tetratricopeptide repeat protein [Sphingomonas naasensis]
MRFALVILAAAPLVAALPAQAQDSAVASTQIVQGDYSAAEAKLLSELRITPDRPELLINLAAVYAKTGRASEARSLYTKVLSSDDVLMDLSAERTAGSHAIAQRGLRRLDTVQFSAR